MQQFTSIPSLKDPLQQQIQNLQAGLARFQDENVAGILLIGSCSRGEATYRSDIDLLLILNEAQLKYDRVQEIRNSVELHFQRMGCQELLETPLPVQLTVVLKSVFTTQEPAMIEALQRAIVLWERDGTISSALKENIRKKGQVA